MWRRRTFESAATNHPSDLISFVLARICGPVSVGDKFQKLTQFDLKKYFERSFATLIGLEAPKPIILSKKSSASSERCVKMEYGCLE